MEPTWLDQDLPIVPSLAHLEKWLEHTESIYPIKQNLETQIQFFNNRKKEMSDTAILYIHGFGASINETQPLTHILAKKLHANVVMLRVARHGLSLAPMEYLTPEIWYYSALRGLAIANKLGKKVLVISCSTGSTLSLLLSARKTSHLEMYQQAMVSPNCWAHPKFVTGLFLTPLHHILEKIPTIPIFGNMLTPGNGGNPQRSPHMVYTPHSEQHIQSNTLRVPTNVIRPMMQLVKLTWTIKKHHIERYNIPSCIIASSNDTEVIYPMTLKFFKNYNAHYTLHEYNKSSSRKQHVIAGDLFSPDTTDEIADIIFQHTDADLKPSQEPNKTPGQEPSEPPREQPSKKPSKKPEKKTKPPTRKHNSAQQKKKLKN